MDIGIVEQPIKNASRILRSNVQGGQHFYMTEDVRSLCLAITECEATKILTDYIERPDVLFHVHRESGQITYCKPDQHVYVSMSLETI